VKRFQVRKGTDTKKVRNNVEEEEEEDVAME
jgi:hypothetical protein